MSRRVVVTGVGLLTPVGIGTEESWRAFLQGENGIGPITKFDATDYAVRFAGELKDFDPLQHMEKKDIKKTDLYIQYALAATDYAWAMAGLESNTYDLERFGTSIGSGIGGLNVMQKFHAIQLRRGPGKVSPFFIPGLIVNLAAGWVSMKYSLKGPNTAPCTACSTGTHAIGDAFRIIARGEADAMVCGGTEGVVCSLAVDGFAAMRALSRRNNEPQRASRPFDAGRDGFVLAEGAGVLVLEAEELARKRGAAIVCEVVGYGASADAYHISLPSGDGDGATRVMERTLEDAGVAADKVDYINAHGTSTPAGDKAETVAIKRVFGEHAYRLAVSSTKSMVGHLLGAAGGVEAGVIAFALRDQVLPPTTNYEEPDPECDLDYVPNESRQHSVEYALSNSFGFGGTNASLLFKRYSV